MLPFKEEGHLLLSPQRPRSWLNSYSWQHCGRGYQVEAPLAWMPANVYRLCPQVTLWTAVLSSMHRLELLVNCLNTLPFLLHNCCFAVLRCWRSLISLSQFRIHLLFDAPQCSLSLDKMISHHSAQFFILPQPHLLPPYEVPNSCRSCRSKL